jgi:hypothetical protein
MSFMHYQNSTTYFHRVCIQSGIVRKKLGFEARCYTLYSLLADTPHKRTPLLNGRFFCDRSFHMLLLIKKILLSGLF